MESVYRHRRATDNGIDRRSHLAAQKPFRCGRQTQSLQLLCFVRRSRLVLLHRKQFGCGVVKKPLKLGFLGIL
jgi:hypothetical protein